MTHLGCGEEEEKKVRQWLKILIILPLCARLNYQVVVESEKTPFFSTSSDIICLIVWSERSSATS